MGKTKQYTTSSDVCVDSALVEGDEVTPYYDPMIAKIVVWGQNRASALVRLREALAKVQVAGVKTNLSLLGEVVDHAVFNEGRYNTGFIEEHREELIQKPVRASNCCEGL